VNKILEKRELAPKIFEMVVEAPRIARKGLPGQFVVVMADERGERVPLTIADFDSQRGTITLVLMVVGSSSLALSRLNAGDPLYALIGPLGEASEIEPCGTVVMVAGGVGTAPVYPIARAFHDGGCRVIIIQGARSQNLLFWTDRLAAVSDRHIITTDDGTAGRKGLVTEPLKELLEREPPGSIGCVYAIGPAVMMRFCAETTRPFGVKTIVSLNSIMVDGTGMCGGCRVNVGGQTRFTCSDGPEFDGHAVDWQELLFRQKVYHEHESCALDRAIREAQEQERDEKKARLKQRTPMPEQDPQVRIGNFDEVALGYSPEQAVLEAQRCLRCKKPACVKGCPVQIDIPAFVGLIAEGRFAEAARKIKEANCLPAVCGRVCPQETQCEVLCILGKKFEPVAVGRLERFAADYERESGLIETPVRREPTGKRVAVVGSGPAGLAVAGDLALLGHEVTVFEAFHKPGGVLMYGIPEFRLPKRIVEIEVDYLRRLGVSIELNQVVGRSITVDELLHDEGFHAVFVGVGAGLPHFMGVPGENLGGVYSANEYLTRSNLMKAYAFPDYHTPVVRGRNVCVVGGGNVAMDAARTARRLGAENVYILYRRSRDELPARREEIHHAEEEGITFKLLSAPLEFIGDQRHMVSAVRCQEMELGEPDDSGRRRPVPKPGAEFTLETDLVIIAVGAGANPLLTQATKGLELNRRGYIIANDTGRTSRDGVWAGGDIVTGSATVILAMGAGKTAAKDIHAYLSGNGA
jgi:glutamate synthase (NADPH/NADH) small chain